jgi:large subunit ribosomal protein L19
MEAIRALEQAHRKPALPQVMSGDTVRVHQLIKEGNKQRIQVFEGVIIRRHRLDELTATITVRRIASGIGVEKTFLLHSPNVSKVEILRRAKVRRNFLSYLRDRRGKSARLKEIPFDKVAANDVTGPIVAKADEDAVVTEIDPIEEGDALNDAVPLDEEIKTEERAERDGDGEADHADVDQQDEAELPEVEIEEGLDKAEPHEEKAL